MFHRSHSPLTLRRTGPLVVAMLALFATAVCWRISRAGPAPRATAPPGPARGLARRAEAAPPDGPLWTASVAGEEDPGAAVDAPPTSAGAGARA